MARSCRACECFDTCHEHTHRDEVNLRGRLVDRIRVSGPISFAEYVEAALYDPRPGSTRAAGRSASAVRSRQRPRGKRGSWMRSPPKRARATRAWAPRGSSAWSRPDRATGPRGRTGRAPGGRRLTNRPHRARRGHADRAREALTEHRDSSRVGRRAWARARGCGLPRRQRALRRGALPAPRVAGRGGRRRGQRRAATGGAAPGHAGARCCAPSRGRAACGRPLRGPAGRAGFPPRADGDPGPRPAPHRRLRR